MNTLIYNSTKYVAIAREVIFGTLAISLFILSIALVYLSFRVYKNKYIFPLGIKIFIHLTSFLSIVFFIVNLFVSLRINIFKTATFPWIYLSMFVFFAVLFPLFFMFYLAWKNEISLKIRYLIIFSYIILISHFSVVFTLYFMETIVFKRKICMGISCMPSNLKVIDLKERK